MKLTQGAGSSYLSSLDGRATDLRAQQILSKGKQKKKKPTTASEVLSGLRSLPPRQMMCLVPGTHVGREESTLKKLSFVFHVRAVACVPPYPPKKATKETPHVILRI